MALSADALKTLGLQREPFRDDVEGDTFYSDPLLDAMRERTLDRARRPNSVTLIGGEPASGRSLMLVWLLANLDVEEYGFRARAGIGFDLIDRTLRTQMADRGTTGDDRALVDLLADRLQRSADDASNGLVLAIDDADLIDNDTLSSLFRMRDKLIARVGVAPRIVLVGQNSLLSRAEGFLSPGTEVERTRVTPLNADQTQAYLRHRLLACGAEDPERLISRDDAAELYRQSEGRPGILNSLATRLLRQRADDARSTRSARDAPAAAAAGNIPAATASARDSGEPSSATTAFEAGHEPFSATLARATQNRGDADSTSPSQNGAAAILRDDLDDSPVLTHPAPMAADRTASQSGRPMFDSAEDTTDDGQQGRGPAGARHRGLLATRDDDDDDLPDHAGSRWSTLNDERDPRADQDAAARQGHIDTNNDRGLDDEDDDRAPAEGPFYTRPWFVPAIAATIALGVLIPLALSILGPSPTPESTREVALPDFVSMRPMPEPEPAPDVDHRSSALPPESSIPGETTFSAQPADIFDLDLGGPTIDEPDLTLPAPVPEAVPDAASRAPSSATPTTPAPQAPAQTTRPQASPPPARQAPPVTPPTAAPQPAPAQTPTGAGAPSEDQNWIRAQAPSRYTIQLIAARDLASAQSYAQRHNLSGIRYASTRRDGQRFVVAVAGSFATRADAEQALARLPAQVRNDGAWLRTFDSLQRILD